MHIVRSTSAEAYYQIKEEGLLSKRRWEVYDALFTCGPSTQMECYKSLKTNTPRDSFTPRFTELKRLGVVKELGERECSVTGRNVLVWDITGRLPTGNATTKKTRESRKDLEKLLVQIRDHQNTPNFIKKHIENKAGYL